MTTERERKVKAILARTDLRYVRERLKLLRTNKGWLQTRAAKEMNYTEGRTIHMNEEFEHHPKADYVIRAALVYGVSLRWILTGEERQSDEKNL